jgi:hypothetical protein
MDLRRLANGGLEALIERVVARVASEDAERARERAPVDSGRLRGSIGYAANRLGYYLYASAPYAHYVLQRVPFMPSEARTVKRLERALERAWS